MSDELHNGTAAGLLQFLDYSAEKGLLNAKTAGARKSACVKVLEIDGAAWRNRKVGEIDIEDQINRFSRKVGSRYSPGSLATYGQRCRDALTEYTEFLANPTGYRGPKAKRRGEPVRATTPTARRTGAPKQGRSPVGTESDLITYPFPLSAGTLGYVQLPREIIADDAERLCHFIRSLAIGPPSEVADEER